MRIVVWVVENTWQACVDACAKWAPPDAEVTLLHVVPTEPADAAHYAYDALLGRHARPGDPAVQITEIAVAEQQALLEGAARRLGLQARLERRQGPVEREVMAAAAGADLLLLARDGDPSRLGPASLGHATRFVVDHVPCALLLVLPRQAPEIGSLRQQPPPSRD